MRDLLGLVLDVTEHLELLAVVVVEQGDQEMAMLHTAEGGRHVADAQPAVGSLLHQERRVLRRQVVGPQAGPFARRLRVAARTVFDEEQAVEDEGRHVRRELEVVGRLERPVRLLHPALVVQGLSQDEHAVGFRHFGVGDPRDKGDDGGAHVEGVVELPGHGHGVMAVGHQPLQVHAVGLHDV